MPVTVKRIPRYIEMTPEQEGKVDKLLEAIHEKLTPAPAMLTYLTEHATEDEKKADTPHNPVRAYAYAFLMSRQWDVDKALEMVTKVANFRQEAGLDGFRQLPAAFSIRGWDQKVVMDYFGVEPRVQPMRFDKVALGIDPHFQCGVHYWDKQGLPVVYMMLGNTDERGLIKKLKQLATVGQRPSDVIWEYVQHGITAGEEIGLYQQDQWVKGELAKDGVDSSEGIIRSFTLVVDCGGLSYKMLWKPAIDLLNETVSKIFQYWPDVVNRIVAVNTPGMVMFAYNIIKGTLDANVQRKVSFYKPNETTEALCQIIDPKHIPKFLGGECECEGRCIRGYDPENPKKEAEADTNDDTADVLTEDIVVKAGKKHEKVFRLDKDETVYWDFATASGKDISFALYFIPESDELSKEEKFSAKKLEPFVVSKATPSAGTDSFHAPEKGTAVLVWDNKASWFNSKTLQMRVYMQAEDGIRNTNNQLVPAVSSGNFVPPAEALAPDAPVPRGGVKEEEERQQRLAKEAGTNPANTGGTPAPQHATEEHEGDKHHHHSHRDEKKQEKAGKHKKKEEKEVEKHALA